MKNPDLQFQIIILIIFDKIILRKITDKNIFLI